MCFQKHGETNQSHCSQYQFDSKACLRCNQDGRKKHEERKKAKTRRVGDVLQTSDEDPDKESNDENWDYEHLRSSGDLEKAAVCAKILSKSQRILTYINHAKPEELHHTV